MTASLLALLIATPIQSNPAPTVIREAVGYRLTTRGGRDPIVRDSIQAEIVAGKWQKPTDGKGGWHKMVANKDGNFEGRELQNGYVDATVQSAGKRVAILKAPGCTSVYVNGTLRAGDPYQTGYVLTPIDLQSGDNDLLFVCGRGGLRVEVSDPPSSGFLNLADATLPDYVTNGKRWLGLIVVNASTHPAHGFKLRLTAGGAPIETVVPDMQPLSIRKVAAQAEVDAATVHAELLDGQTVLDRQEIALRTRQPNQTSKVTFLSQIDGSVQYYALNPCSDQKPGKSLILTLHGAGVEAIGQADSYAPKDWANIVAATNRRPYGFDWEDLGRMDALEVLNLAKKTYKPDGSRIYLTGHSMGGHGTWTIGATYPDLFAAIAPSAGWCSFFTYVGGPRRQPTTPVEEVMYRCAASSDTMEMLTNYAQEAVYILHGDKDDNVPITEARAMRAALEPFHKDLHYHEQPGAGHWWGTPCVDWPGIMELFQARQLKAQTAIDSVDFTTVNPAVSARCDWATIDQQLVPMLPSRVRISRTGTGLQGTTDNVRSVSFAADAFNGSNSTVELDGDKVPIGFGTCRLEKTYGKWRLAKPLDAQEKSPTRGGPFKLAFNHLPVFVYGTAGTAEENAESAAKARYDAEALWYRGNASIDVVSDSTYLRGGFGGRNVIVYGNADINSVWKSLLSDSPVQLVRGRAIVRGKAIVGDDLACLFLRPMSGSSDLSVGVVGGTGLIGMRLTERLPYFTSGVHYPDWIVIGANALTDGSAGIRDAGFFDNEWK